MSKTEFLNHLGKRLQVLNQKERDDILEEYAQHIEIKIQAGLTEEEAIKDFGDADALGDDILDAYNVNPNYNKSKLNVEKTVLGALQTFGRAVNEICDELLSKKPKELFLMLFKFGVVILCLVMVRLALELLMSSLQNVLYFLPMVLERLIMGVLNLGFNVMYIIVVLFTLYAFLKRTFLIDDEIKDEDDDMEYTGKDNHFNAGDANVVDVDVYANVKEEVEEEQQVKNRLHFKMPKRESKMPRPSKERREGTNTAGELFANICSGFFKLCVFCLLLPLVCLFVCAVVGMGILVILLFQGYPVVGLTIGTIGLLMCGLSFIIFVMKSVFKTFGGFGE